jgi:hypothetical protein
VLVQPGIEPQPLAWKDGSWGQSYTLTNSTISSLASKSYSD